MAKNSQETQRKDGAKDRTDREAAVRQKYDFSVIRSLRQQKGLTIEKFAKLCGLSYAPISRIETNLIKPNLDTLDKIAAGLDIRTHALVAMAERRITEQFSAQVMESDGISTHVVTTVDGEIGFGTLAEGAVTADFGIRSGDIETLVVQSGELNVEMNDASFTVRTGEALRYDRAYPHQAKAMKDTVFTVVSRSSLRGK
jgi:transcriptional regulator with XRE-family HTH domain